MTKFNCISKFSVEEVIRKSTINVDIKNRMHDKLSRVLKSMEIIVTSSQPDSIITRIDLVTSSVAVSQETEIQLSYYHCKSRNSIYSSIYSLTFKQTERKVSNNHFKSKAPVLFQTTSEN